MTPVKFKLLTYENEYKWVCFNGHKIYTELCFPPVLSLDVQQNKRFYNVALGEINVSLYPRDVLLKVNSKLIDQAISLDKSNFDHGYFVSLDTINKNPYTNGLTPGTVLNDMQNHISQQVENKFIPFLLYQLLTLEFNALNFLFTIYLLKLFVNLLNIYKYKENLSYLDILTRTLKSILSFDLHLHHYSNKPTIIMQSKQPGCE